MSEGGEGPGTHPTPGPGGTGGLTAHLIDPRDPPARREAKLHEICAALIRRIEQGDGRRGAAYDQFQRAVLLEDQVRERTRDLGRALDLLHESNARLASANRETEQARQDLAQAIETVEEGFALFDAGDRLVLCNSRFGAQMPDVRPRLVPGLAFTDYVGLVSRSPHLDRPDGTGAEAWAADRLARHHEPRAMVTVRFRPDLWVQVTEHRMAGGQTVVMQTDVSDIVRAERESQARIIDEQARLTRATFEHLAQGVCVVDAQGRIAASNRRLAALLSIPPTHLRPGRDVEVVLRRLAAGAAFGAGMTAATLRAWVRGPADGSGGEASGANGTPRAPLRFGLRRDEQWLDVSAEEMPDGGVVMAVTDVGAERRAERSLREANDRLEARVASRTIELEDALTAAERASASRTRFVAAASHDLLQPLSAAKLYLDSLTDELPDARQRGTALKAQNALASVQGIIEALLDISRLEGGQAAVDLRAVDLGPLLAQLRDEFAPAAALKGLRLTVRDCAARVRTDPTWIRRILQNLIGNAIRYTEAGGVLVGCRPAAGGVRIGVYDTGPGIPEAERENVFREFHRLGPRASASEGLGLGLAIVDRACATLGHPLALDSEVGRGTGFTITVPLAPRAAPAAAGRPATSGGGRRDGWRHDGLAVVLVEDDLDMRLALAQLLEGWGVRVIDAGSGAEALRLALAGGPGRPDAILADFQLGEGETGIEVVERLRARLGPLPARLVTAIRSPAVERAARRGGMEVLRKPIDPMLLHLFLSGLAAGDGMGVGIGGGTG